MIIARNVLAKFFKLYSTIKSSQRFMEVYTKRFILRGKRIKYIDGGKKKRCKVLGIDNRTGGLIIETRKGSVLPPMLSPSSVIMPKRIRLKKKEITKLA